MKLIEFPEVNAFIAKDQPEYNTLPAFRFFDTQGRLACCWKLSWAERIKVLLTGKVWHEILTFDHPLQPQRLSVTKPKMEEPPLNEKTT